MQRNVSTSRIETDLDRVQSDHPQVRSYGLLFGLLVDDDTGEVVGVGFETAGLHRTFFRARDALGNTLEAGGVRSGIYHLDRLLSEGLRLPEEERDRFRVAWSHALDVYEAALSVQSSPTVVSFREAVEFLSPEARARLAGIAPVPAVRPEQEVVS